MKNKQPIPRFLNHRLLLIASLAIVTVLILALILPRIGATPVSETRGKWLRNNPCTPPCWENITPGKTTVGEALNSIKVNPMFSKVEFFRKPDSSWGYIFIYWKAILDNWTVSDISASAAYASGDSDVNQRSILTIRVNSINLKLGDLIQSYGEPTHITGYGKAEPPNGPTIWTLQIIWLQKGFMAHGGYKGSEPKIQNDLLFDELIYFPPGDYGVVAGSYDYLKFFKPWHGYDDLNGYSIR
ncbi:MAG: hypothetical protein HZC38_11260 [Chloroflexi bacterium]|nr:hypothetical protein [Chloroflexota bacterium]